MRFYDLCLEVKELDLKDGFENKEEISNIRVQTFCESQNSSNPIGICNPRHVLGICLGLQTILRRN